MPNARLDELMQALICKAAAAIILAIVGGFFLRELLHWIDRRAMRAAVRSRRNQRRHDQNQEQATMNLKSDTAPRCPLCNGTMMRRRGRRGSQIGKEFWGCFGYPSCRGKKAI
jgi:hypothetical protein